MRHTNCLTQSRSLRFWFVLVLGVVVAAIIAADSSETTRAALQPQANPQSPEQSKRGLPNYDIRLPDNKAFEDFDLTSFPGRAKAKQHPRAKARLNAVDELVKTAAPEVAQNLRAIAN